MSRCKSCDTILTTVELLKRKQDDSFEDLCRQCRKLVHLDVEDLFVDDWDRYAFADITENYLRDVNFFESVEKR